MLCRFSEVMFIKRLEQADTLQVLHFFKNMIQ